MKIRRIVVPFKLFNHSFTDFASNIGIKVAINVISKGIIVVKSSATVIKTIVMNILVRGSNL